MGRNRNYRGVGFPRFSPIPRQGEEAVLTLDTLAQLEKALDDGDIGSARGWLQDQCNRCPRVNRIQDQRRPVITDYWFTELDSAGTPAGPPGYGTAPADNQLLTPATTDIIAAIAANAGMNATAFSPEDDPVIRPQILYRTITGIYIEVEATALEGVPDAGGTVFVFNEDLSEQIERILGNVELLIFGDSSATPTMDATPLYVFGGDEGVILDKDLWQNVYDERFRFELRWPDDLSPLNPDHQTRVSVRIRAELIVEDTGVGCCEGKCQAPGTPGHIGGPKLDDCGFNNPSQGFGGPGLAHCPPGGGFPGPGGVPSSGMGGPVPSAGPGAPIPPSAAGPPVPSAPMGSPIPPAPSGGTYAPSLPPAAPPPSLPMAQPARPVLHKVAKPQVLSPAPPKSGGGTNYPGGGGSSMLP